MRIVNFGQMLDVNSRKFAHQMLVVTDDGRQHIITTDESTVQQLINAMTNSTQTMPAEPAGQMTYEDALDDSQDAFWEQAHAARPETEPEFEPGAEIFGGEEDPGETGSEPVMGVIAEDRIADVPEDLGGLGQPKPAPRAQLEVTQPKPQRRVVTDADGFAMPVPSRTVPKDSMGYPIVARQGQVAPRIPDDDGEEDGAQI